LYVLLGRAESLVCASALSGARRRRRRRSGSTEGSGGCGKGNDGGESTSPVRSMTSGGGVGVWDLDDEGVIAYPVDIIGIL
jgi:hypothetical protein